MKAILFLLALLAISFAQSSRYYADEYDYDVEEVVEEYDEYDDEQYYVEEEEETDISFGERHHHTHRPGPNFRPIGREVCKCCRFRRGECVELECCQSYKANCNKVPTLTKPKN